MQASDGGIEFAPDGAVIVGPEFRTLEAAWIEGVAAMARAGVRVIVDEVFLGGADSSDGRKPWANCGRCGSVSGVTLR
ncbi:hypothetical protein SHIRM173S_03120 [Streptomyces hirsutus]